MSFALIGLKVPGVRVAHPECVAKSFPGFWTELDALVR
jgi:3-phosphoshikimate 1-carboxyvinyltransferase